MLHYTPLLFITIVLHAHHARDSIRVWLYTFLLASSLIFHGKRDQAYAGKAAVTVADYVLAHVALATEAVLNGAGPNSAVVNACVFYIVAAFLCNSRIGRKSDAVHATIHIACCLGANAAILARIESNKKD